MENVKSRKEHLDFALGMLFIGGNLSFNVVDSQYFKKFVYLLDPTYKLPCRQTLSSTIIRKVQNKITESIKNENEGIEGTLMIDGWKNSSNNTKNVTAIVKLDNGNEIFLKSFDFSSIPENHMNLLKIVEESTDISKKVFGVSFRAIVTDNAANMIKTGRETNLINYGCKAHIGNLYLNDVFDKNLYADVHQIMVLFKNVQLQAAIKSFNGRSIYLAGETRWKGVRDEMKCFLDVLPMMRETAEDKALQSRLITGNIKSSIWNEEFKAKVSLEIQKLDGICCFIDSVQSSSCTLADAVEIWRKMDIILGHGKSYFKRSEMVCDEPSLLANALHPIYKGSRLSPSQMDQVKARIYQLGEETYSQFEKFLTGSEDFRNNDFILGLPPLSFWDMMKFRYPLISKVALAYVSLPSSTASLERVFSMWAYVHNKSRNRISSDLSEVLIFLYHSMKSMDEATILNLY